MRRIFSLALTMILVCSCISSPAEEEEYVSYTHPSLGYSFDLPSAWKAVDESNLQSGDPVLLRPLTEPEKTDIAEKNAAVFEGPDGYRLTVTKEELGMKMTAELFMSMMMPHLMTEMEALIDEIIFPDYSSVYYTEDDRAFCYLTAVYSLDGKMHTLNRYFYPENESMYVFSFVANQDLSLEEELAYDYRVLARQMLDSFITEEI